LETLNPSVVKSGRRASKSFRAGRKAIVSHFFRFILVVLLPAFLGGCSRALVANLATVSSRTDSSTWTDASPVDLFAEYASASATACSMDPDAAGTAFNSGQFEASFSDYRVVRSTDRAALLLGAGLSSTSHRLLARVFAPGSGVLEVPAVSQWIDEGAVTSPSRSLLATVSSGGEFLLGGFRASSGLRTSRWTSGLGWVASSASTAGNDHREIAGHSSVLGEADLGFDIANQFHSSVAVSSDGWGLAGYPTSSSLLWSVRGFTEADAWSTAAGFSRSLPFGVDVDGAQVAGSGSVRQSIALSDGLGVTVVWSQRLSQTVSGSALSCFEVRSAWFTEAPGGATWSTTSSSTDPRSLSCPAADTAPNTQSCTRASCAVRMTATASTDDFFGDSAHSPIAAETDGQGTVLVVYYATDPTFPGSTSCGTVSGCRIRLFASVRGADGVWNGPTQVDENLLTRRTTTTYVQTPLSTAAVSPRELSAGGLMLPTPGLAYLGSGVFLLVSAVNDLTTSGAFRTRLFARKYRVGSGWDVQTEVSEIGRDSPHLAFDSTFTSNPGFRRVQDLKLASDGQGSAFLVFPLVTPRDGPLGDVAFDSAGGAGFDEVSLRAVQPMQTFYRDGAWEEPETFNDWIPCPLTQSASSSVPTACSSIRYDSAYFSTGHVLLFTPQPVSVLGNALGLFISEYVPAGASP
jgi:hypothetical protein